MGRRLDYRPSAETHEWLDERETWFFDRYLEAGNLRTVIDELRAQSEWPVSREGVYAWLKADDERWQRWNDARELSGHLDADDARQIAENAEQATANRDRLRFEGKRWAAEVKNRAVYGKQPQVQVAIGVGGEWAAALQAIEARTAQGSVGVERGVEAIRATHPSAHALTPASEAPRTVPDVSSE